MDSRFKFRNETLSAISNQILSGKASDALRGLHAVEAGAIDVEEREFLLGYAHGELGNRKEAFRHYLTSAFGERPFLPSLFNAATLLSENGYKNEASVLLEKASLHLKVSGVSDELALFDGFKATFHHSNALNSVIAIHQPAYLPWLGFFHKIFYADRFVILDDVEFSKNSFIKRTLINKTHVNEGVYLTIPAVKHSDYVVINEMRASPLDDWRTAHLRKIHGSYNRSKYFKQFYPVIVAAVDETRDIGGIADINAKLLASLLDILDLKKDICTSSDLFNVEIEDPHERNMSICQQLGGNVYLSGAAAIDYQRGRECPGGLRLIYQKFWEHIAAHPYLPAGQFTNGLSILDALFTVGPEKILDIFQSYSDPFNGYCF